MLTSPRTNGVDHFVPSHHLSLITQPVLGARSRLRKKTNNIIIDTSTSTKDTIDSMTNSRRSSFNDSPPLILPINRVDTLQYQKKINSNSHHESSDSGLDLSLSTNSSVQLQQYPQQHISIHRPLSALNEDSNPDDGYHDDHQQKNQSVHLRFPPLTLGRNRSMEDMLNNNINEQPQHRSSSFSDERQQKLSLHHDHKMKRSSDGILLDLIDPSKESYRRTNDFIYPTPTQQHRSLNDLTNKNSNKVLSMRNESNNINNSPITQTITRKPNTSTLKPLRKKTKLNIIIEPSIPLTSSRINTYDEQINQMTRTTSSSSNQTTPRAIHPLIQQQNKSKTTTLNNYTNQEQIRAHVNRSVVERQHPTTLLPPRRGLMKQMIPFDASPSKVNNLLLRHHVQHNQPTAMFHPNSNNQVSPVRQIKQILPTLHDDEKYSNIHEEKKRVKQKDDFHEIHYKKQGKTKEQINHKYDNNSQDLNEQINPQRHFNNSIQKQQTENISTSTPRRQYEHQSNKDNYQQRKTNINDYKKNFIQERHGSSQSTSTVNRQLDTNENYKKQQKNIGYVQENSIQTNRIDEIDREKQMSHGTKPTGIYNRNKTLNNTNDKNFIRTNESNNQYGNDYLQKTPPVNLQTRSSKNHVQTNEHSSSTRKTQIPPQTNTNQYQNSKYVNDHYSWNKSQINSTSKSNRIQPILSTNSNNFDPQRERETSRLSNLSKAESIQQNEKQFKQIKSPTSWSIISEHENIQIYNKTTRDQSQTSTSPSSHEKLIHEKSSTPSRTYRLIIDDQQQEQPSDGRYVIPSNNLPIPSSHESSRHTHSFICTPDFQINKDNSRKLIENEKTKSNSSDVYILSDRDNTQNTIDRQHSPSPLVHLSSHKTFYSPPLPAKVTISKENDEIISNYDSDDGWSDDSAELLYVDERYATEKRKINSSSHLPTQQNYYYQIQQQNLLLQ